MRLFSSQQETNELVWRRDEQYASLCFTLLNKSFHGVATKLQLHLFPDHRINNGPEEQAGGGGGGGGG